jgi:hypothetical protein
VPPFNTQRDGTLVCNHIHDFYLLANVDFAVQQLKMCYFSDDESYSYTLDTLAGSKLRKWQGILLDARNKDEAHGRAGRHTRCVEHNYFDFAFGEPIRLLRQALPALRPTRPKTTVERTKS